MLNQLNTHIKYVLLRKKENAVVTAYLYQAQGAHGRTKRNKTVPWSGPNMERRLARRQLRTTLKQKQNTENLRVGYLPLRFDAQLGGHFVKKTNAIATESGQQKM